MTLDEVQAGHRLAGDPGITLSVMDGRASGTVSGRQFTVEFLSGAKAGVDDYSYVPCFRITASDGSTARVFLHLSKEAQYLIQSEQADTSPQHRDRHLQLPMLRYGVRRIERALCSPESAELLLSDQDEHTTWRIDSASRHLLTELDQDKDCYYQERVGRDLYCAASSSKDSTAVDSRGIKTIAPTSRPLCNTCALPDTDYLCAHFLHPENIGVTVYEGGLIERRIVGGLCDAGQQSRLLAKPADCRAGGHDCWQRLLDLAPTRSTGPFLPHALPQALDHLDAVWRLQFGKKRGLLHLASAGSTCGLVAEVGSRDDFGARVSELADTISHFRVPDDALPPGVLADERLRTGSLNRLEAALRHLLDDQLVPITAIRQLRNVTEVRVAFQHSGDASRMARAFTALGLQYPPEWPEAWQQVHAAAVRALDEVRQAIRSSIDEPG